MDLRPWDRLANDGDPMLDRLEARLKALETDLRNERSLIDPGPPSVQAPSAVNQTGFASGESGDEASCERTIEQWKEEIRAVATGFPAEMSAIPLVSVITPMFNTKPAWLAEAALSIIGQTLTDWEWCLVDDGSKHIDFHQLLPVFEAIPRIKVHLMERHAGISAATNQGLQMATGKFVCFMDHDDLLAPEALERCTQVLSESFDAVYTDHDKISDTGRRREPFHKPDWSPEYLRGVMYVGHLLCVRRDLAINIGGFDSRYDSVQDFEFMLRYSEQTNRIAHVSEILYHWRTAPGSVAASQDAKGDLAQVQVPAVQAQLDRLKLPADAVPGRSAHIVRVTPRPRASNPKISIIIPTKDAPEILGNCLISLFGETSYPNFEVICVDNETQDDRALALMRDFHVRRLLYPDPFSFSKANNLGVHAATGQYLVFMNNDVEIITPGWVEKMLYYAEQEDIGAVGGLLLYPDRSIQHAGVVLGCRGTADHVSRRFSGDSDGYFGTLACAHEVSVVTAACLMMRKELFAEVGGFNTDFLTVYQDVDLCLQLRSMGKRNIFTPHAVFVHHESYTRGRYYDAGDRKLLLDRWAHVIRAGDPYYNPNLDVQACDYSVKGDASPKLTT